MKINRQILRSFLLPFLFFVGSIFAVESKPHSSSSLIGGSGSFTQKPALKPQNKSASLLYEGEQLVDINQVQTLFKFIAAEDTKPLVLFIPGDGHLARISYGYPDGKSENFLSYWFHKRGYPFLGVSYPTDNPVYSKIYPNFNIRAWGNQVATLAKNIIEQNHLSTHVVVLAWGMGGNIEESVQEAFDKLHINLDAFIGLSATPPLPYTIQNSNLNANKMLADHLADRKGLQEWSIKALSEQNQYNGFEIIPEKIYTSEFLGNVPVALEAEGYFLQGNKFDYNVQKTIEDTGVFNFASTPWIGLITDDSASLPKVVLIDPNVWNFIRSEMLYRQYIFYTNIEKNMNKFAVAKRMIGQIPQHFSATVHGNYFFFVGKKGARETEQKVELIMQHINSTRGNMVRLALD